MSGKLEQAAKQVRVNQDQDIPMREAILVLAIVAPPFLLSPITAKGQTSSALDVQHTGLVGHPTVQIGGTDTEGAYLFGRIRDIAWLSNDRIAVTDELYHELRIFTASGHHILSRGGKGRGPGEFLGIGAVNRLREDSIVVFDVLQRRATIYSAAGGFGRTFRIETRTAGFQPYLHRIGVDGSMVVARRRYQASQQLGPYRTPVEVTLSWIGRDSLLTIGVFEGNDRYRFQGSDMPAYFNGQVLAVPAPDHVFVIRNPEPVILSFDYSGDLISEQRLPIEPRTLTEDHIDLALERILEATKGERRRRAKARAWKQLEFPEKLPPISAAFWSFDGRLWIKKHTAPDDTLHEWLVLQGVGDTDPHFVRTPLAFRLKDVRRNQAVGIWQDPKTGVHSVRVYRLRENTVQQDSSMEAEDEGRGS